jgi:hypothetical protein
MARTLIGRESGEHDFRLHGFSTIVAQYAQKAKAFGADYRALRLPVVTLASLCETHGLNEIDFLKIDVEGAETDALSGGDWNRFRPKVIVAEAVTPGTVEPAWQDFEPLLLAHGSASRCSTRSTDSMSRRNIPRSWRACRPNERPEMPCATCTKSAARRTIRNPLITTWRASLHSASG